jgi:hypothetical protein
MTTHAPSRGDTIEPAVPKEYAVLLVGVATMTPSPYQRASTSPADGDGDSRLTGAGHAREDDLVERDGPTSSRDKAAPAMRIPWRGLDLVVAATEPLDGLGRTGTSISAKNPNRPRFTPGTATPVTDPLCRARNTVPSPPAASSTSHSDACPTGRDDTDQRN